MTYLEARETIRKGNWNTTISNFLSTVNNDSNPAHSAANESIRYPLKQLKAETALDNVYLTFKPAVILQWANRAAGIADAMLAVLNTGIDVCDDDLFDEIYDACKSLAGLAMAGINIRFE